MQLDTRFNRRLLNHLASLALAGFLMLDVAGGHAVSLDDLPDLGESARADLSPQLERKIGEGIMNEIRQREPEYVDDPDIGDYLEQLGRRLVEASPDPVGNFHFFAIRDPSINAFAMFGGYVGLNTGTILAAQTESELAAVVAHEISHITQNHLARQLAKQKQNSIPAMIAMAIGILAARSNSSAAGAIVTSAQAGLVQAQLAYTRDFEREADRVGFQTLEKAGFDVRGMVDFFERLQQAGRVYENNAPVYLRSHPLTAERLSDMQNRAQEASYKQVPSSLDFYLVRAKLRAETGAPQEAIKEFKAQLAERKYVSLPATHYGLAVALLRERDYAAAQRELETLKTFKLSSPILYGLTAAVRAAAGQPEAANAAYREGLQRFPRSKALAYAYAETLLAERRADEALKFLAAQLQRNSSDFNLYGLQAKVYAALGKRVSQHRAQAEYYYLQGRLGPAVEQLQFAQKATDGDFYEQSEVDARLRELRRRQAEEENKSGF